MADPASARRLDRVGLNALYLVPGEVGGTEIYARELATALADDHPDTLFTLYLAEEAHERYRDWPWPANLRLWRVPIEARIKPLRLGAELGLLPTLDARARNQVLHSLGTTTPFVTTSRRVVTVHDLMYAHFPQAWPTSARLGQRALVPLGARRAARVITDSHAVRGDLLQRIRLAPEKVDVVHLGLGLSPAEVPADEGDLRRRWALGDATVVLCVSAAFPHKNLERLIRAMASEVLKGTDEPPVLVLVGHPGSLGGRLGALASELGFSERLRVTGWIGDRDLEGFYAMASCFAYPSLFEGFGMPVLEAMRRGVPVVCSAAWSLPEVAGDAAELCDPLSVESIAAAISRVLSDDEFSRELVQRGYARTRGFTWSRAASETWRTYTRALRGRTSSRAGATNAL